MGITVIYSIASTNMECYLKGQYLPEGINQAWTFLVGERFKAETRINAQPGIALTVN